MSLEVSGARTYEPKALLPQTTCENAMAMLTFYQYTGNRKFLYCVPGAIKWLEKTSLPKDKTLDGRYTHPTFVEMGTNKALYDHRKGSNSKYGKYFVDYNDEKLLGHYGGKRMVPLDRLKEEYKRLASLTTEEATKDSPLKEGSFQKDGSPLQYYKLVPEAFDFIPDGKQVETIINSLDSEGRWLVKHASISNPYIGDGVKQEPTDEFGSTNVGDETDTSPFRDASDYEYISTGQYIMNMNILIKYLESKKKK
jgi:hypothetical protein